MLAIVIVLCVTGLIVVGLLLRYVPDLVRRLSELTLSKQGLAVKFYAEAVGQREQREISRGVAAQALEGFPGGRILWVDDEPAGNEREMGALRALGVKVDVVTTNAEALAYVAKRDYDLVVSDIRRPGLEEKTAGLAMPAELEAVGRPMPVVYYVGRAGEASTDDGQPVVDTPSALFAELRRLLAERAQR